MTAWYSDTVRGFLGEHSDTLIAALTRRYSHHQLYTDQITAWRQEVEALRAALMQMVSDHPKAAHWFVLLEYKIPRRAKRIDVVILARDVILVIEFKTSSQSATDMRQLEDYALDLRDFHLESSGRRIVPVLVVLTSDEAIGVSTRAMPSAEKPLEEVTVCSSSKLAEVLLRCALSNESPNSLPIDLRTWDSSPYHPTPTIIEAAIALYSDHSVAEITHSHAGTKNLALTSESIIGIIREARERNEKAICFVTGVPGAGKTLAGLNAVHSSAVREDGRPLGVFLSGNRPLVSVVREAIVRDRVKSGNASPGVLRREVETFVQNVHEFIDYHDQHQQRVPSEHVAVFDEAQRAWNAEKNKKKFGRPISEPAMMLDIMDRQPGWAVLVALVGGGQEIHDGEAGLAEWGCALRAAHQHWRVHVSPEALRGGPSVAGSLLFTDLDNGHLVVTEDPSLHLEVSLRSYRAKRLSDWVNHVLAGQPKEAAELAAGDADFPVYLCRDLARTKSELRRRTLGSRRCGLVASSGALRLRADGIELSSAFRQAYPYQEWFLAPEGDIRSSRQLEVAATEFEIQGLELDWAGVCWGSDLTWHSKADGAADWQYRRLSGANWQTVRRSAIHEYMRNKYRVLLTRAREGMVVWVPEGDPTDETRQPEALDRTATYLQQCGMRPF